MYFQLFILSYFSSNVQWHKDTITGNPHRKTLTDCHEKKVYLIFITIRFLKWLPLKIIFCHWNSSDMKENRHINNWMFFKYFHFHKLTRFFYLGNIELIFSEQLNLSANICWIYVFLFVWRWEQILSQLWQMPHQQKI